MKRLKQILAVVALVFCCSMVAKADTKAAQITGVKQTGDATNSVTLTCDPIIGTSWYAVDVSTDNKTWTCAARSSNSNSIYVGSLGAGRTYYVRVVGASQVTSNSNGTYTYTGVTATASNPIEVVTRPNANIKAVQSGATTSNVKVTVSQADGANYYKLFNNQELIAQGSSATLTSKTLNPGTRYYVTAYACRMANTGYIAQGSSSAAYLYVRTLQNKISKSNFGLTIVYLSSNSFKFEVNYSGYSADGYQLQLLNSAGKVKKTLEMPNAYIYTSNLKGTFYKYRVRSYVKCGSTPVYNAWSDTKTFAFPKKATGKYVGGKLKMNWSKVNGATKYIVYVSNKENSGYKKIKTLSAKKRNITISKIKGKKLKKGKPYYIRILPVAKKLKADSYAGYTFRYY